jgi:nucleotide-binding universal stress UspA family protein
MKILATFDGSVLSESTIPELETLCALPGVELVLLRVGDMPHGRPLGEMHRPVTAAPPTGPGGSAFVVEREQTGFAETKEQAVERAKAELYDYLTGVAHRLPAGVPRRIETMLDDNPKSAIVRFAIAEQPDLIVMATHGHTGLVHLLFGDVAESVMRSGVAPVLLVPPQAIKDARQKAEGAS